MVFFNKMIKKYIKNYLLKKKHPKRTSANQMYPFGNYDAPKLVVNLSAVLLQC